MDAPVLGALKPVIHGHVQAEAFLFMIRCCKVQGYMVLSAEHSA